MIVFCANSMFGFTRTFTIMVISRSFFFLLTVFLTFLFIGLEYTIHPISSKINAPINTYNPEPEAFIFVSNKLADLLRQ